MFKYSSILNAVKNIKVSIVLSKLSDGIIGFSLSLYLQFLLLNYIPDKSWWFIFIVFSINCKVAKTEFSKNYFNCTC